MTYLCMKDSVVVNAIEADPSFIAADPTCGGAYDSTICYDTLGMPLVWIGCSQNPDGSWNPPSDG